MVQFGFAPKAVESCGGFGKIAYAARLALALRGKVGSWIMLMA